MPSKSRTSREGQLAYWEGRLQDRMGVLSKQGYDQERIAADAAVRGIKAKIRETKQRLRAIDAGEKKIEEMARLKLEKEQAPQEEKSKKKKHEEEEAQVSKRQQKKAKKKAEKGAGEQAGQ
jgi:archaellum component FlaD/FlaE